MSYVIFFYYSSKYQEQQALTLAQKVLEDIVKSW